MQHPQNVLALEGPRPEELMAFAALARRLYYDKDAHAGSFCVLLSASAS